MKKTTAKSTFIFVFFSLILFYCVIHGFEYSIYYVGDHDLVIGLSSDRDLYLKAVYEVSSCLTACFMLGSLGRQITEALFGFVKVNEAVFTSVNGKHPDTSEENRSINRIVSTIIAYTISFFIIMIPMVPVSSLLYGRTMEEFPTVPDFWPVRHPVLADLIPIIAAGCYAAIYYVLFPRLNKRLHLLVIDSTDDSQSRKLKYTGYILYLILYLLFLPVFLPDFLCRLIRGKSDDEVRDPSAADADFSGEEQGSESHGSISQFLLSGKWRLPLAVICSDLYLAVTRFPAFIGALKKTYIAAAALIFVLICILVCLIMTWISIFETIVCISDKPEEVGSCSKEVLKLHESYKKALEDYQKLQFRYDQLKKNDKAWMTLFLHALGTNSSSLSGYIHEFEEQGWVPYAELKSKAEAFGRMTNKCYLLQDAIAGRPTYLQDSSLQGTDSRKDMLSETTAGYFLREYRKSYEYHKAEEEIRFSWNIHGLGNEEMLIDEAKTRAILDMIFQNAAEHARKDTVASVDFNKINENYVFTVSNVIYPDKEEEIRTRLDMINRFWTSEESEDERNYPAVGDRICIGLIAAKINAQNMDADLTFFVEDHLRFVTRLTIKEIA